MATAEQKKAENTATHIFLELDSPGRNLQAQALHDVGVRWEAILVNAGKRYDAGELKQEEDADGKPIFKDGKPLVKGGKDLVLVLVWDALDFRRTRMIPAVEVGNVLSKVRDGFNFVKSKNNFVNFSTVQAVMDGFEAEYRTVAFADPPVDCRGLLERLYEANVVETARGLVVQNKMEHILDLASSVGQTEQVKVKIGNALAMEDFTDKIAALGEVISTLFAMGAKTTFRREQEAKAAEAKEKEYRSEERNRFQSRIGRGGKRRETGGRRFSSL